MKGRFANEGKEKKKEEEEVKKAQFQDLAHSLLIPRLVVHCCATTTNALEIAQETIAIIKTVFTFIKKVFHLDNVRNFFIMLR